MGHWLRSAGVLFLALCLLVVSIPPVAAAAEPPTVRVQLDGRFLPLDPPAVIVNDRTLVPLRAIFEALSATVGWEAETRTVTASRAGRYLRLRIDSKLACLDVACDQAEWLDVAATIRENRTFVPVRFVSSALGATVEWLPDTRTVSITTGGAPPVSAFAPLHIVAPARQPGQIGQTGTTVTGTVDLKAQATAPLAGAVRFYLLDRNTGTGPLVGMVPAGAAVAWRPDPAVTGPRLLLAVATSQDGRPLYSTPIPVVVAPDTTVTLTGVAPGATLTDIVTLGARLDFVAAYVRYERLDGPGGPAVTLGDGDPQGGFTWYPSVGHNGPQWLRVTAYDRNGTAYRSNPVPVKVNVAPRAHVTGVSNGQTVSGSRTLGVAANVPLARVRYWLGDPAQFPRTTILLGESTSPGAGLRWIPEVGHNGRHQVWVETWDTQGQRIVSAPLAVQVKVEPAIFVKGVGPGQVVTGAVTLQAEANHLWQGIEYRLTNPVTGQMQVVAGGPDVTTRYIWTPTAAQAGEQVLQAWVQDAAGRTYTTASVRFRVFLGKVYGPEPIVPKDQFLGLTARLADPVYRETGMSAALQVAQAILETGWGQSAPVDKYTGQRSNNLFGIKGMGPAGSVISNTWEEYNGVAYRVDDKFRAYNSVAGSWQDHADFLLKGSRYAPVRAVMWDPVQGAWALRRAGYATDSRYAIKLVDIMNANGLFALDQLQP